MGPVRARVAAAGAAGAALVGAALLLRSPGASAPMEAARPEPSPSAPLQPASPAGAQAVAAPASPPPTPPPPPPPRSEAALTERLRALVDADPSSAVAVSEEAALRFPDGPMADERSLLKMRALVHLGRIGAARDEAEAFFERFPDSPYAASAYRLTGVHPRPASPFGRDR